MAKYPAPNGVQSTGTSSERARLDHVHPSDSSKVDKKDLARVALTGSYNDLTDKPEDGGGGSIVLPSYSSADIGKTLGVIDDGNGNPVLAWVDGGGSGSGIYVTDDGNGNVTITGVSASETDGVVTIAELSAIDDGAGAVTVTTPVINV